MKLLAAVLGILAAAAPLVAQGGTNPHGALPEGLDCVSCHTLAGWTPLRKDVQFDHDRTGFRLDDKHGQVACGSCHGTLRFARESTRPRECASCHTDVHAGRFGRDCTGCHDAQSFMKAAGPQAHARSSLPLSGAHAAVPCESCHRDAQNGSFTALDTRCMSCHQADYQAVQLPSHSEASFPQECTQCHSTLSWQGAQFDHAAFQLTGPHRTAGCTACHAGSGNQLIFPRPSSTQDCVACHRADYDEEHAGSGFPTTCLSCHRSPASWDDAQFEHATVSNGYTLLGAHIRATCGSCHVAAGGGLLFSPAPASPQECVACHNPDYQREHTSSGYPTVCMTCHDNDAWANAVFRHDAPATLDCVSCHRTDYDRAHTGTGYSTTCRGCHASTTTWQGATISHDRFPLTGPHGALACASCHAPPNNALIYPVPSSPNDCVACHRSDYDREHSGSGFSTNCQSCHAGSTWSGATFDHAAVARGFALRERHAQLPCTACHAPDGRPLFSPAGNNDCVSCHQAEYSREHAGSGFPVTCATCHTQTSWSGSSFNHDAQFFPIYSGKHDNKWSTCTQCHTTPADFRVFSCTTCHSPGETNNDHREVSGYAYDSARCYSCHPRGD
jgi:hypothetical protein